MIYSIPFCDNTTIYSSSLFLAGTQGVFRCLPLGSITMISWYMAFDKFLYTFLLGMYLDMLWPNTYCQAVSNVLVQIWAPTISVSQVRNLLLHILTSTQSSPSLCSSHCRRRIVLSCGGFQFALP